MKMTKKLSAKYCQEKKERLQKIAWEGYQNLSKEKNRKKATVWSWTLQKSLRNEQNKSVEHRKKCCRMRKNALLWL